jgi:hypothetical protein
MGVILRKRKRVGCFLPVGHVNFMFGYFVEVKNLEIKNRAVQCKSYNVHIHQVQIPR